MEDLHSDAETEGSLISIPSDACTAPDGDAAGCVAFPVGGCSCCKKQCVDHMDKYSLEKLRSMMGKLDNSTIDDYICDVLRQMQRATERNHKGLMWLFQGQPVCRSAWRTAFGVGNYRLKRMTEHVGKGFAGALVDLRRTRALPEPSWQQIHVDEYLFTVLP